MRRATRVAVAVAAAAVTLLAPAAARAQGERPLQRCDFTDPAVCLYPWPNDLYTERDRDTPTGRRLALPRASMPANQDGVHIDPSDMNRADGFSPGSMLLTKVPGLDSAEAARASRLPPIGDVSRSLRRRSPVVVINARTGRRHPVWVEIDSNPDAPTDRVLIVRPARNFAEGERYVVALRSLERAGGRPIRAGRAFRLYRDRVRTRRPLIERRRPHFERLFNTLRRAGIRRGNLFLAWDFTVASRRSLSGRALHIRDRAFAQLGDRNLRDLKVEGRSPRFTAAYADIPPAQDQRIARIVTGTITTPCFLSDGCAPGGRFVLGRRGLPTRRGSVRFDYTCQIPRSALDPASPRKARPALYGHGLLGSRGEIEAGNVESMSNEHNFVFCATDWAGFSGADVPTLATALADLSEFGALTDRMQQGFLHQLLLGRALIHPRGLGAHPAFQKNGRSLIDSRRLYFDGNSQGGIMGGALTALAPDFQRAVLGVPGMNFSTLIQRSVAFDRFAPIIYGGYPKEIERQLWIAQIQLLWDRGEANGYAHHITGRPLPNTPAHTVLMHVAFGDHLVADFTTQIMARTLRARVRRPVLDPGRSPLRKPWYGVKPIRSFPYAGSAVVWWDTGPVRVQNGETEGTAPAPLTNTPPRVGKDPHEAPRAELRARVQKSEFLKPNGRAVDVCGAAPCYARGWTGLRRQA